MVWLTIAVFVVAGGLLIIGRRPAAELQALAAGGRIPPGCAVAEGIALIVLAIVVFLLRSVYE